jgi:cell division protein FtsX
MEDDLANHDGVTEHSFVTKEEALAEARVLMADEPDALAVIENDPSILPASLRFVLTSPEDAVALRDSAAGLDGVSRATLTPQCAAEQ